MPQERPRRDRRDRGRALLPPPRRRLRGHRPRGVQERQLRQDDPGRLDADDAAHPHALHRRPRDARSSARCARRSSPRSSRTPTPAARARSGSSRSTSTPCPTGPTTASRRSASRPRRARTSTSAPRDLTLAESALLAGLPQAPSDYNPFRAPGAATARRNEVLRKMADLGYISDSDAQVAIAEPLELQPQHVLPPEARELLLRLRHRRSSSSATARRPCAAAA